MTDRVEIKDMDISSGAKNLQSEMFEDSFLKNLKNLRNFPKETGPILDLSRLLKKQKK